MSGEMRRFSRISFKVQVEMAVHDAVYKAEELKNLSIGGCLLPITADLELGTACHLKILLGGVKSEQRICLDGEIVRCPPGAVAVKFVQITPDSLYHLQNVIRYNSPDLDVIEQEIHEHPGLV